MPGRTSGMMPSLRGGVSQSANNEQATASSGPQQPEMNEPVDEPALRRTWKQLNKAPLLGFLRQQLRNSRLDFSIVVNAAAVPKVPLTPRERMAEMRKENPEMIDALVNTFGLELS